MERKVIVIYIIMIVIGLPALYSQNIIPLISKRIDVEKFIETTKDVKSISIKEYVNPIMLDDEGLVRWSEKGFSYYQTIFNDQGIISKEKMYRFELLNTIAMYNYNLAKKVNKIMEYSDDGKYLGYSLFEYVNEKEIIQKVFTSEERESWKFIYQIDKKDRITSFIKKVGSKYLDKHVFKYNNLNQCIQLDIYKSIVKDYEQVFVLDISKAYSYDDNGNLIEIHYPYDDAPYYKYEYEFDDKGNCITRYGYIIDRGDKNDNYKLHSMLETEIIYF